MQERAYYILKKKGKECLHHVLQGCHYTYPSLRAHLSKLSKKGSTSPLNLPANDHIFPSDLILAISTSMEGDAPSNTAALRCFHNFQIVRMKIVCRSLRRRLFGPCLSRSQASRVSWVVSVHCILPKASQITAHTARENTHVSSTWLIVSSSRSHRGHAS